MPPAGASGIDFTPGTQNTGKSCAGGMVLLLWSHGINLVLGFWLLVAPLVLPTTGVARVNEWILGVIVLVLTALSIRSHAHWPNWANVAAGVWLVIAPFVLVYTGVGRINDILVGLVVAGVTLYTQLLNERAAADVK